MEYNELQKIAKEMGINPIQKKEILEKLINNNQTTSPQISELQIDNNKISEFQSHIDLAWNKKLNKNIQLSHDELDNIKNIEELNKFIIKNKLK